MLQSGQRKDSNFTNVLAAEAAHSWTSRKMERLGENIEHKGEFSPGHTFYNQRAKCQWTAWIGPHYIESRIPRKRQASKYWCWIGTYSVALHPNDYDSLQHPTTRMCGRLLLETRRLQILPSVVNAILVSTWDCSNRCRCIGLAVPYHKYGNPFHPIGLSRLVKYLLLDDRSHLLLFCGTSYL